MTLVTEEDNIYNENVYNEIVERDKLIYDIIGNRYNLEWERSKSLEGKAIGIITFVGIILSLQGGIGAILINDAPKIGTLAIIINLVFIFSVFFLTLSIISGLWAFYVQTWIYVPKASFIIKKCGDRSRSEILCTMAAILEKSIFYNRDNNNKKKNLIVQGFIFLFIGVILNLVFIIGLIFIMNHWM